MNWSLCPKYHISIVLYSLVNLDRLEKRRKKNKKLINSGTTTDDDETVASSSTSSSNKRKGNQPAKKETLMDYLKKIENGEVSEIIRTDSSSNESLHVKHLDVSLLSNEALMSEANKVAKDNLLKSSDSDVGK